MACPAPLPALLAASLVGMLGCRPDAFACDSDQDCRTDGGGGWCEVSGYCGFSDDACDSGRRYGSHAPSGLAGDCVPLETGSESGSSSTEPQPTLEGQAEDSSEDGPTTTADPSTSSTSNADESSDGPTSTSNDDATSTEESGDIQPDCEPTVIDDFDDETFDDAWQIFVNGDCNAPRQSDGYGILSLPETQDSWCGVNRGFGPLQNRALTIEWDFDGAHEFSNSWFQATGPHKFEFATSSTLLDLRIAEDGGPLDTFMQVPFDPEAQRFLRIRATDDEVFWETSPDGSTWTTLHGMPHDDLDQDYWVGFGTGAGPQIEGTELRVERTYLCP